MRLARTLAGLVIAAAVTRAFVACSTFGSAAEDPGPDGQIGVDGPTGVDGPPAVDGPIGVDADAAVDSCTVSINVDEKFEDPAFPAGFTENVSSGIADGIVSGGDRGVDGGGALSAKVQVVDIDAGPRARIERSFDIVPNDIVMELDVKPPSLPELYAQVGCGLYFYGMKSGEPGDPRVEVVLISADKNPVALTATVHPGNNELKRVSAGPIPSAAYLRVKVHITLKDASAHADLEVNGQMKGIDFDLGIPTKSMTLACGLLYADNLAGIVTSDVDNLRVNICGSAPP